MGTRKKKKGKRKRKRPEMAATAERHELYQKAVQRPEADIYFFSKTYKKLRGRKPRSLREDFCGTAYFATEWVKGHHKRSAIGIDLDAETLEWGRQHVLGRERSSVRSRVELVQANVLDVTEPKVDICCAMNFSFCVFKTRRELVRYFRTVHTGLASDGVFFTELYGGTEAITTLEENRKERGFIYHWEQERYNPITNETLCHIHFELPDGSRLNRAFTYDWRLWSIPEVRECLEEAGFPWTGVYWEGTDKHGEGTGEYCRTDEEENQETWIVYIVAAKQT